MNVKQKTRKRRKIKQNILALRRQLWPDTSEDELWDRKTTVGFTTIPRGIALIHQIMDQLSSGKPLSSTYLSLWCRAYDEAVVTVTNPQELALEAGFLSQRKESTWRSRIKILEELGFIRTAPGASGDYHYILLMNPYRVVMSLKEKGMLNTMLFNVLFDRANQVGATDLVDYESGENAA